MTDRRRRVGAGVARVHHALYAAACGRHPDLRPWHFQWLAAKILSRALPQRLARLRGDVLDVGCEDQPYRRWAVGAHRYVGADVSPGPRVDVVLEPGRPWPFDDGEFDGVICTQVLEHVADLDSLLAEIARVLRPEGLVVLSVPFIYSEHGGVHDYRRLSRHGVLRLLDSQFTVEEVVTQGGVGSSVGALMLNWVHTVMTSSGAATLVLTATLPIFIAFCAAVNGVGELLDRLDRTDLFYGNVLVVARRREIQVSGEGSAQVRQLAG